MPVYLQESPNIFSSAHTRPFNTVRGLKDTLLKWQISWYPKEPLVNWNVTLIPWTVFPLEWNTCCCSWDLCCWKNLILLKHSNAWVHVMARLIFKLIGEIWFDWLIYLVMLRSYIFLQFFSYYCFIQLHFLKGGLCSSSWCLLEVF